MKRLAIAFALALVLTGCPKKEDERAPIGSPGTAKTYPEGTRLPGFQSVRAEQAYVYALPFRSSRTDVIKSVAADEIVIERRVVLNQTAQEAQEVHQPLVSNGRPFLPGGQDLSSFHKVKEEKLVISGAEFECDVLEAEGGGQTVRHWVSSRFPFLLKSQANETVMLSLTEILLKAPTPVESGVEGQHLIPK